MSIVETVTTAVKDRAHSFKYIRKSTGLDLTDKQFLELIGANEQSLLFTRIRRADAEGKRVQPGLPGVKLRGSDAK
jgi:hypothetical protein